MCISSNKIFNYDDYRSYLVDKIEEFPIKGRGVKKKISDYLSFRPTYLSKILTGKQNLSLEHVVKLNKFFEHSDLESRYFLYLVLLERSNDDSLKDYIKSLARDTRKDFTNNKLTSIYDTHFDSNSSYYKSWYYSAIFILLGESSYQTVNQIQQKLQIPIEKIRKALEDMENDEIITKSGSSYTRKKSVFASHSLPSTFHSGIKNSDFKVITQNNILNTSMILSVKKDDLQKVEGILVNALQKCRDVIDSTSNKSGELRVLNLECFSIE